MMELSLAQQVEAHRDALDGMTAMLPQIEAVAQEICDRLGRGGIVYSCGNGGSAADAQHLTGELTGRYLRERRALAAISLSTDPSVLTCIANDYDYSQVFSRQLEGLCRADDVVVGFSTSGSSPSVLQAMEVARKTGAFTVGFTGASGTGLIERCDQAFVVPAIATARIQEMHTLVLHLMSDVIDRWALRTDR